MFWPIALDMKNELSITVAGAGVAGLAVAGALAMRGHKVHVAERAAEITEVGAGIQISPNGMCVIDALGCGDALRAQGLAMEGVRLIDGPSDKNVLNLGLESGRKPWTVVRRAKLIDILKKRAVDLGATLETGRVIEPPTGGQALIDDDLLIGADGLNSLVRAEVEDETKAFFTRQVAWRAIIPDQDAAPEVQVRMGPGRHLVSYPLAGGLRNIVAVEERSAWAEEGWSHEDHPANLRVAFANFAGPVDEWLERVEKVFLWGLFRHPVAQRWHSGRQVLIGDAAHPTLPFLAQGANLALEDAWVLAKALSEHPIEEALNSYRETRRVRAIRVTDAASKNARNYHLSFPPVRFAAHTVLRVAGQVAPDRVRNSLGWIYDHDVTA